MGLPRSCKWSPRPPVYVCCSSLPLHAKLSRYPPCNFHAFSSTYPSSVSIHISSCSWGPYHTSLASTGWFYPKQSLHYTHYSIIQPLVDIIWGQETTLGLVLAFRRSWDISSINFNVFYEHWTCRWVTQVNFILSRLKFSCLIVEWSKWGTRTQSTNVIDGE